ncbi:MAG: SsrA-binding protein SmpB [Patescibacteria group bacterium]
MSLVLNRKVRFNYEILQKFEVGIVLQGVEVKAVRGGHMSLDGAHVSLLPKIISIKKGAHRLSLIGATITPLQPMNVPAGYEPVGVRQLLMKEKEMDNLEKEMKNKGITIVPLSVFAKRGLIKIEIALVRGKKKFDKRETLKKKDAKREIDRVLKGGK